LRLYEQPVDGHEQKFVVTEDEAYSVLYIREMDAPKMIEILGEILDLDDPEVVREVDGKVFGGTIILGYYDPSVKEVIIHTPLENSDYLERGMKG
jgi:hypothetical protein